MKKRLILIAAMFLAPLAYCAPLLELQLPNGESKTFSREDLEGLPQVEMTRKTSGQPDRIYTGPSVESIFVKGGVISGEKTMKSPSLTFAFSAIGADGHTVAMSVPEVDSSISEGKVIIALQRDHAALSGEEGPLRLIVEKDLRPVRWVKNLARIVVSEIGVK